jgi:hypothetical protein
MSGNRLLHSINSSARVAGVKLLVQGPTSARSMMDRRSAAYRSFSVGVPFAFERGSLRLPNSCALMHFGLGRSANARFSDPGSRTVAGRLQRRSYQAGHECAPGTAAKHWIAHLSDKLPSAVPAGRSTAAVSGRRSIRRRRAGNVFRTAE